MEETPSPKGTYGMKGQHRDSKRLCINEMGFGLLKDAILGSLPHRLHSFRLLHSGTYTAPRQAYITAAAVKGPGSEDQGGDEVKGGSERDGGSGAQRCCGVWARGLLWDSGSEPPLPPPTAAEELARDQAETSLNCGSLYYSISQKCSPLDCSAPSGHRCFNYKCVNIVSDVTLVSSHRQYLCNNGPQKLGVT